MAEAVVEDRPQPRQKFYCHLCNEEIQSLNTDYTCPICSGGFIEEIPESNNEPASDAEMQVGQSMDELEMIRDELTTLLMPFAAGNVGGSGNSADGGNRSTETDSIDDDPSSGSSGPSGQRRRRSQYHRGMRMQRFNNFLLEILQTNEATLGNTSMLFMGNPGDYAWGREGIDTIVTQLLNQMDTAGPPPLPKDKIEEIPNVGITQEQVDIKLQCSVCWEDFILSESVRRLPCLHVYHENCIVPWLELHGTCPICRKFLSPDGPPDLNPFRHVSIIHRAPDNNSSDAGYPATNVNGMQTGTENNSTGTISSSSQQPSQTIENDILNSLPLTLTRIFGQPSTSSHFQHTPLIFSISGSDEDNSNSGSNTENYNNLSSGHQLNNSSNSTATDDVGNDATNRTTGNESSSGNLTNNLRMSNEHVIFQNDDGTIDFEFD